MLFDVHGAGGEGLPRVHELLAGGAHLRPRDRKALSPRACRLMSICLCLCPR